MNTIISSIFFALLLTCHLHASPPDPRIQKNGVVKGNGYSFEISAPKGWVLDLASGAPYGRDAELYPERSSFKSSPTVMFITAVSKKTTGCETVTKLANANADKAKKEVLNVVISSSESLKTSDNRKALVKVYASTQFQSVAYVDEDSTIIMFVLRSRDKNRFDNARYSLKDLVGSYKWLMKKAD